MVFIDALRGIAAFSVVLYHAKEGRHVTELFERLPRFVESIVGHGHLGVAVFFVLSGFVISHSLRGQPMSLLAVGRFMLRRSIRLDPPYWAAIALTIGFGVLATAVVKEHIRATYSPAQIVAHLFYLQDVLEYGNINSVFWTLCFEVQFYLVYALLLCTGLGVRGVIAACAVSLLWPLGLKAGISGFFPPLWHGFMLGAAAYWTLYDEFPRPLFGAFVAVIFVAALVSGNAFSLTCALTAAVIFLVGSANRLGTALNWRWLQYLGLISYSLYLIHNPITGATFRVGYIITGRGPLLDLFWWGVSVIACIVVAAGMWWLLERPSSVLSKRIPLTKPGTRLCLHGKSRHPHG